MNTASRLFFALWPDAALRPRLAAVAATLPLATGRRIPVTNLHATLLYVGAVAPDMAMELQRAAARIVADPCEFKLDSVGWWQRPRIAWLGARVVPAALVGLTEALRVMVWGLGIAVEDRPFSLHVTVARDVTLAVPAVSPFSIPWTVTDFALMASLSGPGGGCYEPLAHWPLVGGSAR